MNQETQRKDFSKIWNSGVTSLLEMGYIKENELNKIAL